jgi:hypothetical protein
MALTGFIASCQWGPTYEDTVSPQFNKQGIHRIGLLVWCSRYVATDLSQTRLDRLDPSETELVRLDDWDKALTPTISASIQKQLTLLGYTAVDVGADVSFKPELKTGDALAALRKSRPDLDAILLVSYAVSPLHVTYGPGSNDPNGSVSTSHDDTATYDNGKVAVSVSSSSEGQYFSDIDGLNLRGIMQLVDLSNSQMIWEIGRQASYGVYSSDISRGGMSRAKLTAEVCRQFGTKFAMPSPTRHGFPLSASPTPASKH